MCLPISIQTDDAVALLRAMPADSVHCVVTSPPYWGLRDYGTPPAASYCAGTPVLDWRDQLACFEVEGRRLAARRYVPRTTRAMMANDRGPLGRPARYPPRTCRSTSARTSAGNAATRWPIGARGNTRTRQVSWPK